MYSGVNDMGPERCPCGKNIKGAIDSEEIDGEIVCAECAESWRAEEEENIRAFEAGRPGRRFLSWMRNTLTKYGEG